jgi:hypothetical protein
VEAGRPDTKLNFPGDDISELPAKKRVRLSGSEEERDGSEEERNEEQRQQCLPWLKEYEEIEQIVVAELVAILGRQEAEKAIMAEAQRAGWGGRMQVKAIMAEAEKAIMAEAQREG